MSHVAGCKSHKLIHRPGKSMQDALKKILYIEDDPVSRMTVAQLLEGHYEVIQAANGIDGLHAAVQYLPDLILIDIHLPDISGTELATKLRSISSLQNSAIVALTGDHSDYSRELSLIAGCDGYLKKPIEMAELRRQIADFLEGKKEEVDEDVRAFYQQQYQTNLVENLTGKVRELQRVNDKLTNTTSKLTSYTGKLEILLRIINTMQGTGSPEELKETLISALAKDLGFERCAFLQVDHEKMEMTVAASHGFAEAYVDNFRLPYEAPIFQKLFDKDQIAFFANHDKVINHRVRKLLNKFKITSFAIGILGPATQQTVTALQEANLQKIYDRLGPNPDHGIESNANVLREHVQEFLAGETLDFGGFIFLDFSQSDVGHMPYELNILQTLFQNASLMYHNLRLRERMLELFVRTEREAVTDHLTTLYNHRYFKEQLARELNRARRHKSVLAMLMIDIDHFKVYNDTFGHQAGDFVLMKVAQLLRDNTRNTDIVARYGGEEFVVICLELELKAAVRIAEKLCKIISKAPFHKEEMMPHGKVTVSIGVAAFPINGTTIEELIHNADTALYTAKHNGRNRVEVFCADSNKNS